MIIYLITACINGTIIKKKQIYCRTCSKVEDQLKGFTIKMTNQSPENHRVLRGTSDHESHVDLFCRHGTDRDGRALDGNNTCHMSCF